VITFVILVFGTPDIRTHFVDYYNLLHLNMITPQSESLQLQIDGSKGAYLALEQYPAVFGFLLYILSFISLLTIVYFILFNYFKKKIILRKELFICLSILIFITSLFTLRDLGAGSNRALVLLPFMILIIAFAQKYYLLIQPVLFKKIIILFIVLGVLVQVGQTFAWISLKYQADPRSVSSKWIEKNLPIRSIIGIENIPIYQMLPDIIVKEFYSESGSGRFSYQVIDSKSPNLPSLIILSSADSVHQVLKKSTKIDLINRLNKEGYIKTQSFSINFFLYDLLGERRDFIFANLIPMPTSISIYAK